MSHTPYLNIGILQLQMPISFQFPLQAYMAVGNWIWLHIHLGIYASLICMNTKRENRLHSPPLYILLSPLIKHLITTFIKSFKVNYVSFIGTIFYQLWQ